MNTLTRKCSKCKKVLPLTDKFFYRHKGDCMGFRYICKNCQKIEDNKPENREYKREKDKEYYYRDLEESRKVAREDYHKNIVKRRRQSANSHRKCDRTPERRYSTYTRSAKKRKHYWGLSFEQFMTFWQKPCYYCGDKIETIGIDRFDNSKGYTIDNVVACCEMCNRMKSTHTKEELLNRCQMILNNEKKRREEIFNNLEIRVGKTKQKVEQSKITKINYD